MEKTTKYRIGSEHDLWLPVTIEVYKGTIIGSSDKRLVEIGSNFESMRKYWEQFDGENKYTITLIPDENTN
ncbi:MAG: hypothetical protein WC055_02060 [Melioribacteraceae bacterium]